MSDYMKKNIVLFIAVMLFISLSMKFNQSDIIWGTDKTLMTKAFVGTYSSEMDTFCHVIADPEAGNIFYYINPSYEVYFKGKFEKCSGNEYLLTGNEI